MLIRGLRSPAALMIFPQITKETPSRPTLVCSSCLTGLDIRLLPSIRCPKVKFKRLKGGMVSIFGALPIMTTFLGSIIGLNFAFSHSSTGLALALPQFTMPVMMQTTISSLLYEHDLISCQTCRTQAQSDFKLRHCQH